MPLKVAHIGAGRFCRAAHAPALRRLAAGPGARLALEGIADMDMARPERAAALAHDFSYKRAYADWRRMIDAVQPDMLVCTVAPALTPMLLQHILPLGLPILIEKPQALTIEDARRVTELATRHRVKTYVAFNRRRMPTVELAHQWSRRRRPRYMRVEMLRARPIEPGFCVTTGVHAFDAVRYLAGEVTDVLGRRCESSTTGGTEYRFTLHLESGGVADVHVAGGQQHNWECYRLEAEGARLEVTIAAPYSDESFPAGARVFDVSGVQEVAAPDDPLVATGILPQYERFLDCLCGGEPIDCSVADAERSLEIAIAADAEAAAVDAHVASAGLRPVNDPLLSHP